jgi:hypothetical protein
MNAYICDECGKQEQTDYRGLSPRNWYTLNRRADSGGNSLNLELCSPTCLQAATAKQMPAPEPPPAPDYVPASPLETKAGVM